MKKQLFAIILFFIFFICNSQVTEDGKLANGKTLKEYLTENNKWDNQECIKIDSTAINKIPVFRGCDKNLSLENQKKCLNKKLALFMVKKFKLKKAKVLPKGIYRIYSSFKISKNGEIIDIESYAKYLFLEEEANRVLSKVPKLKAGEVNNTPVNIKYMLPLKFNVN